MRALASGARCCWPWRSAARSLALPARSRSWALKYRLFHLFSAGYGFDGIVVAFMAAANPILVPLAALFLGGLKAGAQIMQRAVGVDSTVVDAIQGLVVIFVAAGLALRLQDSHLGAALRRRRRAEAMLAKPEA